MAIDERLAARVRRALARVECREQHMFGGIAFMVRGHMCAGLVGDRLMLRLGKDGAAAALAEPHTAPMDFTGKPLSTMIYVEPAGIAGAGDLRAWLDRALDFNATLKAKG